MSATNRGAERRVADFYPTPAWCTRALLRAVPGVFDDRIVVDPFAGDGAILSVLEQSGIETMAVELREECRDALHALCGGPDWVHITDSLAHPVEDFLPRVPVVTNPPFSRTRESIARWAVGRPAAFLLPSSYYRGQDAAPFWTDETTPHAELKLPRRPAFVAVCKGLSRTKARAKRPGCGRSYPVGTRGRCECGGTIGDGTDAQDYIWALWNVPVDRPIKVLPMEWCI